MGDVSFGRLSGLEPLEIAADAYGMQLGFFPGGVNPRNETETKAFDGPSGERFILALESVEVQGAGEVKEHGVNGLRRVHS